ncbi:membrane protein insertase YidC [Pseudomonas typographi]|uniref:Membrane protein insertase YidC n=1 Tax=Pseudomonas typographi TaxID=2715964 RepID=A0ABR7Z8K1_9PSED|nr:membrane protein insertase YidC [Pseudomonas typographi]MBD1553175.1 membrane protein insertase YidC [Pseudomonas typographi]MBD1585836.1 membrane protein insertase YidC [Pseudomonas typographi]MBD1601861.1 membrane protein insertase YidC [Pseudomonas typographi]
MDIKRTILMVALAVVAYTMVLKWNQDYGQAPLPNNPTANQAPVPSDVPQAPSDNASVSDLPNTAQPAPPSASVASSGELIHIRTDVLDLAIDPKGGDVVQLTLPEYPRQQDRPDVPFQLFDNGGERVYIGQSGLVGANGPDGQASGRPLYSSEQKSYRLADGQEQLVVDLKYSAGDVNYIKRFTLNRGEYDVVVSYLVDNQSAQPWNGNVFAQLKRDASSDPSASTATSTATYLGAALWTPSEPYKKVAMKDIDKGSFKETVQGGWVAWLQHYFVTAWIPSPQDSNNVATRKDSQGNYIVGFTGPTLTAAPGGKAQAQVTLYAGPKIQDKLKALSPGLELTVDYGFLWFIAQPIFWLLKHIHSLLGNWGWSIICLTVLIKLLFFPLSAASYRSMARMRAVAPRLAALKEQFGSDRQKMSQAMMELYKKERINPLGGCLPIVVQMPVFLALYWVLLESVEMRQVPWMFWITDLSVKDPFFILPIIMGATMFIQQRLNPAPPDPMQAKVMKLMPIVFTVFFLMFPAGLVLYWITNNTLSILQQWVITRRIEAASKKAEA